VTTHPQFCWCPDFDLRQAACKHLLAFRSVLRRESLGIPMPTPPEEPPIERPRKTYPQVWPAYDAAQKSEKAEFRELLADLCQGVVEPPRKPGRGRRPV